MRASVKAVHELVTAIEPGDDLEAGHRADVLSWLATSDDIFRRVKPATPDKHLVSYACLVDPDDGSTLLVDHINAGLWLPPGGHVELDEDPAHCAAREVREELSIEPVFAHPSAAPAFVTVTRTVGVDSGHTDVSLWFVMYASRSTRIKVDKTEFRAARWWSRVELADHPESAFDPYFRRFTSKIADDTR